MARKNPNPKSTKSPFSPMPKKTGPGGTKKSPYSTMPKKSGSGGGTYTPLSAKKPTPKPKSKGGVWVFPDGSTVGQGDLGKVKPTPKPKPKASPLPTLSDKEYFKRQQEYLDSIKKSKKK